MVPQRLIDSLVGLFMILAAIALVLLALKVSGLTNLFPVHSYEVTASFDDIGGLKARAPVKLGGVQIGEVSKIALDPVTFKALVTLQINDHYNQIPDDSSAGILTAGLLGDNYIEITPMYNTTFLKQGSKIDYTRSAMILEKLIGQFMYKVSNSGSSSDNSSNSNTNSNTPGTNNNGTGDKSHANP